MSRSARALPFLVLLLMPLGYALGCGNSGGPDGSGGAGPGNGGSGTGGGNPATGGGANPTGGAAGTGGAGNNTGGGDSTGGGNSTGGGDSTGGTDGTGGSASGGIVPGTDNYDCSPASGTVPALELVELENGLDTPIFVTHPPNDQDRLFVIEQDGSIAIIEGGTLVATRFLEFQDKVYSEADGAFNEQGFLGLAFHPNYAQNGLFYVHYSAQASGTDDPDDANGDTIISEFHVSADANVADDTSERIVLTVDQLAVNHNGGSISFGSDGFLYIGLGDGGNSNDTQMEGQDPSGVLGSILRIDPLVAGAEPYTSAPGNLVDEIPTATPEVWDYGLRNPYRFNFDACSGALYIGDVGQDAWEEVNVELAGEGHKNYGWNIMEGAHCRTGGSCDQNGLTLPIAEYEHVEQEARTVVGGSVYRGADIPALRGAYFYLDAYTGEIWYLFYDEVTGDVTGPTSIEADLNPAEDDLLVVAVQNAADGELLFVSRNQGAILQLAPE